MAGAAFGLVSAFHPDCGEHHSYDLLRRSGPEPGVYIPDRSGAGDLSGPGRYYLPFAILWRNINPLIPLYTHGGPLMAGHALYGGFPGYPHNAG
jgi:hypothetical protein